MNKIKIDQREEMAPTIRILNKEEVPVAHPSTDCVLKSLVQYECEINNQKYVCKPFKRIFQECISSGQRTEITSTTTNCDSEAQPSVTHSLPK